MEVIGAYEKSGYALVRGLVAPEVARAFMRGVKEDMGPTPIPLSRVSHHSVVLKRPAFEIYGNHYKPLSYFLWALTPVVSQLTGRDLLPSYDYFRIYQRGDICRVHTDRPSCEHSVSLTLEYSDGQPWALEVGKKRVESHPGGDDFADEEYSSLPMQIGDAVLYQGVHYAHGRTVPNPNGWSAHLFLHYVDRDGPFGDHAFDRQVNLEKVNFSFG
jgi:hypothetical protein